jgi:hypothetical protein
MLGFIPWYRPRGLADVIRREDLGLVKICPDDTGFQRAL